MHTALSSPTAGAPTSTPASTESAEPRLSAGVAADRLGGLGRGQVKDGGPGGGALSECGQD